MAKGGQKANRSVKIPVQRVGGSLDSARQRSDGPALDELLRWDEKPVKMDQIEHGPRRRVMPVVLLVLGAVFLATFAGFAVFTRTKGKFSEQGVKVELKLPAAVASGDEVSIEVSYLNSQPVALKSSELTVTYPEGFSVTDVEPGANSPLKNGWSLGTVQAGFGGRVTIRGLLVGPLESQRQFSAVLTYRPANFNSDFSAKAEATTTISSSIVSFELKGPSRAAAGKEVTLTAKVKNTADRELERVRVLYEPAEGFTLAKADPAGDDQNTNWLFDKLAAGEEKKIALTGSFDGKTSESRTVSLRLGLVDSQGTFTEQSTASLTVTLVNPELSIEVKVNGANETTAKLGETLTYTASYKNNSDFTLTNVVITGQFTGKLFDWGQAAGSPEANLKDAAQKGTVTWSKASVPALARLATGASGELTLTVPLVSTIANQGKDDKNFSLSAVWQAKTATVKELGGPVEGTSETVTAKIVTTVRLATDARYYAEEGNVIGSGPLPPTVGKTTSYRVSWILSNTTSDLADVTVQTTLPETVFWTGKVKTASAGTLDFDPTSRIVSWRLNQVPAGTGIVTAQLNAEFEVSVTPKQTDLGLLMVLTDKTTLKGTDDFLKTAVSLEQPSLTTDLLNDSQARGKGIVVSS